MLLQVREDGSVAAGGHDPIFEGVLGASVCSAVAIELGVKVFEVFEGYETGEVIDPGDGSSRSATLEAGHRRMWRTSFGVMVTAALGAGAGAEVWACAAAADR